MLNFRKAEMSLLLGLSGLHETLDLVGYWASGLHEFEFHISACTNSSIQYKNNISIWNRKIIRK